jgi:hypothetical protein
MDDIELGESIAFTAAGAERKYPKRYPAAKRGRILQDKS